MLEKPSDDSHSGRAGKLMPMWSCREVLLWKSPLMEARSPLVEKSSEVMYGYVIYISASLFNGHTQLGIRYAFGQLRGLVATILLLLGSQSGVLLAYGQQV